jgi:hypothetical protein
MFACNSGLPNEAPRVQELSACIAPEGGWQPGEGANVGEPLSVSTTGTVTESGSGAVPDGCFDGAYLGYIASPTLDAKWFKVDDGVDTWTVGVRMTEYVAPISGEGVTVAFEHVLGGFGPDVGSIQIDANGGRSTWLGIAGGLLQLATGDALALSEGEAVFERSDDCGEWRGYDLQVALGGATYPLPYGEVITAGTDYVVHGGYEQSTGEGVQCADWFVANVRVGMTSNLD